MPSTKKSSQNPPPETVRFSELAALMEDWLRSRTDAEQLREDIRRLDPQGKVLLEAESRLPLLRDSNSSKGEP